MSLILAPKNAAAVAVTLITTSLGSNLQARPSFRCLGVRRRREAKQLAIGRGQGYANERLDNVIGKSVSNATCYRNR